MQTDLSQEFDSIFFNSELQYIRIDFKRNAYYVLNVNLTKQLRAAIEDILVFLQWLDIGNNYNEERKKRSAKK